MTAHVRKAINAWKRRNPLQSVEAAFRAGVRFEQGRQKLWASQRYAGEREVARRNNAVRQALATALEILSRTPAGKREADKLREVLRD